MAHKEKYCVYWHCERNGRTTCWDWGGINGREWPAQMMKDVKNTVRA